MAMAANNNALKFKAMRTAANTLSAGKTWCQAIERIVPRSSVIVATPVFCQSADSLSRLI
jgi:hypothetical protein